MSSTFENEKEFSKVVVPTILEFVRKIVICGIFPHLRIDLQSSNPTCF
ncbi:hypothetical protein LEP1GSC103_1263 [Leptospira borgpetersenii serovar Javanica str. UI 09931]|uniref:Uncharacterized protein n=4 Tax=Leptospira borgpetersenii TaxID=174 RepID=M3GM16_LEPBO|nr:hypothetical protein LEP1GSC101_2151 [Leptospira borgpetersenii str. UI 09149]EKQ99386.1 hypothetical protein LEP1GSC121_2602 [Leptospira borgpetersenii serovar Castellonis str. 200801910]EMG02007.1 hypothetical protein LEP1GSC123_0207 [Leptospira borgpetersenii str. 200701203]EMK11242.1 hypothetical protein LEP1GSC066_3155 [Leptospira sp. serovar Kenya str. Sh9]EMN13661.1 hypothetical protein LEP1GSC055_3252 [Leptospira borgpetersenii str. Brem 307]EMN15603.1 hypothetical protein LEP1GSC05